MIEQHGRLSLRESSATFAERKATLDAILPSHAVEQMLEPNKLEQFERWAAAARGERPPRVDVAERVRATVNRLAYQPAWYDSPWLLFAGASLAAAALVAAVALPAWESVQDPLVAFCRPLSNLLE